MTASELSHAGVGSTRESRQFSARTTAIAAVSVAGVAAGVALAVLPTTNELLASKPTDFALVVALGWSFIAGGLVVWSRRPDSALGPVTTAVGFAWFGARLLVQSGWSPLFTAGMWLGDLWIACFAVFCLWFPDARPRSRWDALLAAPFLVAMLPLELAWLLCFDPGPATPRNALLVWPNAGVADALDLSQRSLSVVGSLALTLVLARRWARASPPLRRGLTAVFAGALAIIVSSSLAILVRYGGVPHWLELLVLATWTAVPLAILLDLVRARLARSAVGDLVLELSANPAPGDVREALARALGDPSLSIAYWLPEYERYADLAGTPVEPKPEAGRAVTVVERRGEPVAALLHDASLCAEPALLDGVSAAAGMALENARLESELRAGLEELRGSRARILDAVQAERRRLERDLHDGAQQRLVSLSLELGFLDERLAADPETRDALAQVRAVLVESLQELRELARGIHPAVVTNHGLGVALDSLASRCGLPVRLTVELGRRLPESVEVAAYYVVSESLTNVARYAEASAVTVDVQLAEGVLVVEVLDDGIGGANTDGGSGIRGLADRVEGLGGRVRVWSPQGGGTRLRAEIPCA